MVACADFYEAGFCKPDCLHSRPDLLQDDATVHPSGAYAFLSCREEGAGVSVCAYARHVNTAKIHSEFRQCECIGCPEIDVPLVASAGRRIALCHLLLPKAGGDEGVVLIVSTNIP